MAARWAARRPRCRTPDVRTADPATRAAWAGLIGDYSPSGLGFTPKRREKLCWIMDGGAALGASRDDRIRAVALELFAAHGTSAATLQIIA